MTRKAINLAAAIIVAAGMLTLASPRPAQALLEEPITEEGNYCCENSSEACCGKFFCYATPDKVSCVG